MQEIKKKILVNLCVFSLFIILNLTLFEIGVRVYEKTAPAKNVLVEANNETIYSTKPNLNLTVEEEEFSYTVKTNSEGFRDKDFSAQNIKNGLIFSVGDSMTFGQGVELEETFSNILEKELALPVFNLGVNGFTTFQEYRLFEKYFKKYPPNTVILNIYFGNDIAENSGIINRTIDKRPVQKNRHDATTFEKIKTFFRETLGLHSYMFFAQRFDNLMIKLNFKAPLRLNTFTIKLFDQTSLDDKELIMGYEKTFNYILKFKELAQKNNVNLLVVLMSPRFQVRDSEWKNAQNKYEFGGRVLVRDLPNKQFRQFFEKESIKYIDLYEPFKAASDGTLYYNYDGHWTAKGHRLAANEILKALSEIKK